jgi:hypothetical protein
VSGRDGAERVAPAGAAFGLVAAGGAVAALAAGALAAPVALAVAGVGLLGGAASLMLGRRRHQPSAPLSSPDPAAQLDELTARVRGRVNPMVESRVARVVAILRETLPRLDQLGAGSHHAHLAVRTATSYLPEAVGAYMRLPARYADRRPVSGGRTSLMLLCDQLDLLAEEMDKVFVAVCAADVDALIVHERFLQETFGTESSLTIAPEVRP